MKLKTIPVVIGVVRQIGNGGLQESRHNVHHEVELRVDGTSGGFVIAQRQVFESIVSGSNPAQKCFISAWILALSGKRWRTDMATWRALSI